MTTAGVVSPVDRRNGLPLRSPEDKRRLGPLLQIGLQHPLLVREERLTVRPDACRVLYISDIHLRSGRAELLSAQILDAARCCKPDLVLLGGDLVDRSSALPHLEKLVRAITDIASVLAVGGNHDKQVGLELVSHAVILGGGRWIHDGSVPVTHRDRVITLSGPGAAPRTDGDVRILCAHNPRIWRSARKAGYDVVLAGHLHGCQFVACEYRDRLFPGAFVYPYCFLSHRSDSAALIVSRGVSDLLPIRWKCPREVVLCHV